MAATELSSPPPRRRWLRALRWILAATAALVLLLVAHTAYVLLSFDPDALPARYGQVDAQLYAPAGEDVAPRPLLVLFGGGEGGNAWAHDRWQGQRDRFLAQGYALLAIGYFGLPNTPEHLDRIALEGIHAAIQRAAALPQVDEDCIALIGGSRGGELALLLASHYPDIDAVVAMVPASAVFVSQTDAMLSPGFARDGEPLPFVPMPWSATPELILGDIGGAMRKMVANEAAMEAAAIPVERIRGPVLLISATHDEMWPSREMSEAVMARLAAHDFPYVHQHWALPGGHAAPLGAFDRIEAFLGEHFATRGAEAACDGAPTARSAGLAPRLAPAPGAATLAAP